MCDVRVRPHEETKEESDKITRTSKFRKEFGLFPKKAVSCLPLHEQTTFTLISSEDFGDWQLNSACPSFYGINMQVSIHDSI